MIAIAFIYLPIIRRNVEHFTHVWNIHNIRRQSNRPWLIAGKPYLNYFHPKIVNGNAIDCGRPVYGPVLKEIKSALESYGKYKMSCICLSTNELSYEFRSASVAYT